MNQDPTINQYFRKETGIQHDDIGQQDAASQQDTIEHLEAANDGKARLPSGFFDDNRVLMCTTYP